MKGNARPERREKGILAGKYEERLLFSQKLFLILTNPNFILLTLLNERQQSNLRADTRWGI